MRIYKELLSEYTKCSENVREYVYGFGSGNKRYRKATGHDISKEEYQQLIPLILILKRQIQNF
mgnify:FL=1